ncbi:hypothetical protein [Flexithrix dorotheae]
MFLNSREAFHPSVQHNFLHGMSYWNLEEMMWERGLEVDYTTLYGWV